MEVQHIKSVLIVGKDSYIGNKIDSWLTSKGYRVSQLDTLSNEWETYDYSGYDAIVHVAGIVHQPQCNDWELYKRVNTEMPFEIASKARKDGVKHYVFFSTMGVYGLGKELRPNIIDENTPIRPSGMYGRSKYMAEQSLKKLEEGLFGVAIVRPPSVYGKGCRGNYISGFASVVNKLPIIPVAYQNVRQSMLYIDNLCELIFQIVDKKLCGVFCPQDDISVNANEILATIGRGMGKTIKQSKFLGIFVYPFRFVPIVKKAYGGIEYSRSLSEIKDIDYCVVPFKEGMKRTVG